MHVLLKFVPLLKVGEVAASLACDHNLTARSRHFLEYDNLSASQCLSCSSSCHKTSCASTYNYNVCFCCHIRDISSQRYIFILFYIDDAKILPDSLASIHKYIHFSLIFVDDAKISFNSFASHIILLSNSQLE